MLNEETQTEKALTKTPPNLWDEIRKKWPEKFKEEERFVFQEIHPGDRIFVSTGCGEPQHLVQSLLAYVQRNPKAFLDAELINVVTLGVAPYTDEKFRYNFRLNSFFVGNNTRNAVNRAAADYTPIFLSAVPELIRSERIPLDVALIQTTLPDEEGNMNLGVSVDVVKAAAEKASLVIAQPNSFMPRVPGDGNINIEDVDFLVPQDEPLLQYIEAVPGQVSRKIGGYVSRIVEDGSTIQVGYGSMPNAIVSGLSGKKHLGVHTELLSDGIAELMMKGIVDNTQKSIHPGRTIATFCMGSRQTYDYLNDNEMVEFKTIDYTNNPLHRLPAWQKRQGEGHGPDSHCSSCVSTLADRGGKEASSDLCRSGLCSWSAWRISRSPGDIEDYQIRPATASPASQNQRRAPDEGLLLCSLR